MSTPRCSLRVAVIGAGPAGMTAALELSRGGAEVVVYEAADQVGGLARSLDLWGQRVDLGPHRFFSTDARVNRLWLDVVGRDYHMVDRVTRLLYQGRFYRYPLEPANALENMGLARATLCVASYLRQRILPSRSANQADSFESWVVDRFGRRLFEMFFKSYSEKLWGIPCDHLDADFAAPTDQETFAGRSPRERPVPFARARHPTLVDRFAYPAGGTGSVYQTMAHRVRELGGQIHLNTPVLRLVRQGFDVTGVELADGRIETCQQVISTMPLTLLVRGLGEIPAEVQAAAESLTFRNTILVYLHVDAERLFDDQWIYLHSPELLLGRVTNFRNWVGELCHGQRTTILAGEFWCNATDPLWSEADDVLIARAERELRSTGLLGNAALLAGHVVRVPRCYPVYARGYRQHVRRVVDYLRNFRNLTPIGRYGAFKYNNQDHSILMGILAAENLLASQTHDLWAINADSEPYQEHALITETGLVAQAAVP